MNDKAKMPTLPLVVVEWDDAWTSEQPATLAHFVHKPERIVTIGWLMKNDEVGVHLANEFYDDMYRGRTFVPRAMVVKVTHFRLAKPTRRTNGDTRIQQPRTEDSTG